MPRSRTSTTFAPVTFLRSALSARNVKRAVARGAANQLMNLLDRSDDESLIRMTRIAERIAPIEHYKAQMRQLRELFEQGHPSLELTRKLMSHVHPNCRSSFVEAAGINSAWLGHVHRKEYQRQHGVFPPFFMAISTTMRCTLNCKGCYAGRYPRGKDPLDLETLDRLLCDGKEMGMHLFVILGGEPFMREDLFELYEQHSDCWFLTYTNGLLIDDKMTQRLVDLGNVAPAVSIEGWKEETDARRGEGVYERVIAAMDRMREARLLFGFSGTPTSQNVEVFTDERWIDFMIEKGCLFGYVFMFVPVGQDDDLSLMLSPEQRDKLRAWGMNVRRNKPIFVADFWNDGCLTDGCLAGGQLYLHINYRGDVEPCVFMHFADTNIKDLYAQGGHLRDALQSDFFCAVRERNRKHKNRLQPCMIVDHTQWLEDAVTEGDAYPTHEGADQVITTHKERLQHWSGEYAKFADAAWESGEYDWAKKDDKGLWATAQTRGDKDVHQFGEDAE